MERIKKLFSILFVFTCIIPFYSCEDDRQTSLEPEKIVMNSHTIPQDVALEKLKEFMEGNNKDDTRGIADERKISNVFTVKCNDNVTRTFTENKLDCENLLYVANFENEQGFAILAADDRIPDEVIALTSNGSVSPENLTMNNLDLEFNRPILKGYPITGPGFFTDPQYPDEEFMNPNTADLYDEIEGDTLVGNFVLDEEDEYEGEYAANDSDAVISIIKDFTMSYAISAIQASSAEETRGNTGGNIRVEHVTSAWHEIDNVYPLLYKYNKWHQQSPFNDLYPIRRHILRPWKKFKAAAGCFPLAIAKIMTFLKTPATYTYRGYTIDWNSLDNVNTENGKMSAAYLLRGISDYCNSRFFYHGTFTSPKHARKFMRNHGFSNVEKEDYELSTVRNMLKNKLPVIIYGRPKGHPCQGHAWNIDGYSCRERSVVTKIYEDNVLVGQLPKKEKRGFIVILDIRIGRSQDTMPLAYLT